MDSTSSFPQSPMGNGYYDNHGLYVPGPAAQYQGGYQASAPGQYPPAQYGPQTGVGTAQYPQSSYAGYGNGGPGNDYGIPVGEGEYNTFTNGNYMAPYSQGVGSPAMSYATPSVVSPVMSAQALPYNAGAQNSVTSQAWGNLYNPGNINNGGGFSGTNKVKPFASAGQPGNGFMPGRFDGALNSILNDTQSINSGSQISNEIKKKKNKKQKNRNKHNKNKNAENSTGIEGLMGSLPSMKLADGGPVLSAGGSVTSGSRASSPDHQSHHSHASKESKGSIILNDGVSKIKFNLCVENR